MSDRQDKIETFKRLVVESISNLDPTFVRPTEGAYLRGRSYCVLVKRPRFFGISINVEIRRRCLNLHLWNDDNVGIRLWLTSENRTTKIKFSSGAVSGIVENRNRSRGHVLDIVREFDLENSDSAVAAKSVANDFMILMRWLDKQGVLDLTSGVRSGAAKKMEDEMAVLMAQVSETQTNQECPPETRGQDAGARIICQSVKGKGGEPMKRQFEEPKECVDAINKLQKSAVFAMSRGSHELFHTNIWAWLIEKDHAFIEDFFGNKIQGVFKSVKREQGNRDLTIWVDDKGKRKAYVVENKFKALPHENQLKDYEQELKKSNEFGGGLLVSLQTPPGSDKWTWDVLTQEELMRRLENRVRNSTMFSDVERQIIVEYAEMTYMLAGVLKRYSDELGENWPSEGAEGRLEDAKLGDIFKKMKAAEFVQFIENQAETKPLREAAVKVDGHALIVQSSFSNKSGIVDFKIVKQSYGEEKCKGKLIDEYGIGIQLQGNQYKRVAYVTSAHGVSDEELYRRLSTQEIQWFNDPKFMEQGSSMKKCFCKYVTKNDIFVYQHIDLKEYSFSDIYNKMMTRDLKKVVGMAQNGLLTRTFVK